MFLCGFWFSSHTNVLLNKLWLDAKHKNEAISRVTDWFHSTWDDSWNSLPTCDNWEHLTTHWISTVICFVLGITTHLLGYSNSFFDNYVLSFLYCWCYFGECIRQITSTKVSYQRELCHNSEMKSLSTIHNMCWQNCSCFGMVYIYHYKNRYKGIDLCPRLLVPMIEHLLQTLSKMTVGSTSLPS